MSTLPVGKAKPKPEPRQRPKRLPPNYICYPEAFKGRVDKHGNWLGGKLPRCRVCKGLLPPKENHVCSGYVPQLPYTDYEAHIKRMELLREDHEEAIDNAREDRRYERLHTCKRCGEQVEPDDEHQCERLQCDDCGEWVTEDECWEHQESCRGYVKF